MSESFDSEDDKKKEDPQDRWARELKMRLEHEHKMKIDGLRRVAREWERQQRINLNCPKQLQSITNS